jgi:hypothetical protein
MMGLVILVFCSRGGAGSSFEHLTQSKKAVKEMEIMVAETFITSSQRIKEVLHWKFRISDLFGASFTSCRISDLRLTP